MGRVSDAFDTLGLENDANKREIKLAYLKLAKKLHPDVNKEDPHANEKFLNVRNAYETVIDQKNSPNNGISANKTHHYSQSTGFKRDFFKFNSIFDSIFNEARNPRGPTTIDKPKTHVDLRKRSKRGKKVNRQDFITSFDKEFMRLIKRLFNDF